MIRVGIGGWTFEPWRGTFYPPGLRQADELNFASRAVTAIEINGTFYSTPKRDSLRKWADATPDDFVFAVKASRYAVNRRELAGAKDSIDRFLGAGLDELGPKLGPILWQLAGTKQYDADDIAGFLMLLPKKLGKLTLRHVIEPRHISFANPGFIAQVRDHGVAIVLADSDKYPLIPDVTADFVYARLQQCSEDEPNGYSPAALKLWAGRAQTWEKGEAPSDLKAVAGPPPKQKRDVFMFMIAGDKVRAPAAATAMIKLLK